MAAVGLADATADLVDLTLTSPSYVFRDEVLTDAASLLLPAQRLQNMTYTLADAPPEALGLSSATPSAHLQTPRGAAADDRHGARPRPQARDKLLRFFIAWLEVKEPDEFTIAPSVFPEFTPAVAAAVRRGDQAFLEHHLAEAAPKLKDITAVDAVVRLRRAGASIYGVRNPSAGALVELDPAQRLGIFTQPAVIASHSGPDHHAPGQARRVLHAQGDVPAARRAAARTSTPPFPTTAGATERQRIESVDRRRHVRRLPRVHQPVRLHAGELRRHRPLAHDRRGPADRREHLASSFLDEGPLSAELAGRGAASGFTSSLRFQQCFVRQLFRFYMGRDETAGDDPAAAPDVLRLRQRRRAGHRRRCCARWRARRRFSQRTEAP